MTPPQRPSASSVDRDEAFAAWLAMNDYLLDCEFLAGDVPNLPDDPYTEAGLRAAEAEALRRFPDSETALAQHNRAMYDKFVRFIGEVFVRSLGGQWTNKAPHDSGKAYLGVKMPWDDEPLTIPTLFTSALARRTGEQWAFVYRNMREDWEKADAG